MKLSVLHACVVIILFFPLLAWPSLQPSPPWWTTMSATTTWAQWSPSRCIHPRRSPRPGTRRSPATCWGRKTSQGRFLAASSLHNRSSSHTFSSYNCVPAMIICGTLPGVNADSSVLLLYWWVIQGLLKDQIGDRPAYFLFSCCLRIAAVFKTMSWFASTIHPPTADLISLISMLRAENNVVCWFQLIRGLVVCCFIDTVWWLCGQREGLCHFLYLLWLLFNL